MQVMTPSDRRQTKRNRIKDDVYITIRPNFYPMGKVKDASLNGVGFEYVLYEKQPMPEDVVVDIFSTAERLHLAHIRCKVAYDVKIESYPSFASFSVYRCGLQFKGLVNEQIAEFSLLLYRAESRTQAGQQPLKR